MAKGDATDPARGGPSSDNTGRAGPEDLAIRLSELARTLQREENLDDTLQAIVEAAVGTIPGVRHAGISLVENRRLMHTRAATGPIVDAVDRAQSEAGEGPCLNALYDRQTIRLADMAAESRWPAFTKRAVELGVGSMLCLQLYVERDDLGSLNLHSPEVNAFDDDSEQIALMFAAHAGVAMAGALTEHQLSRAITVRDTIGQAKGILMERHKLNGDQAFRLLVRVSQHTNTKLADIARYLVDTGDLVDRGPPRRDV